MKRQIRSFIVAGEMAAVIAAGILVVCFLAPSEPSYQPRNLSSWLRDFESDKIEARARAADAVRHLRTNAVPFLMERLKHPAKPKESQLVRWWRWSAEWLMSKQTFIKFSSPRPPNIRCQTLAGLDALGSAAQDALPALENLLNENPPDSCALYVVGRIGQAGVPLLTKSLTNLTSSESKLLRIEARVLLDMMNSHSETLFRKVGFGRDGSNFDLRICQFNSSVLGAALKACAAQHPEMGSPTSGIDSPPPSSFPP